MAELIKNTNLEKISFTPVLDYLHIKHKTLINDYKTPDGQHSESCLLIAVDIAKLFLQDGHKPYILEVTDDVKENGFIHTKQLVPLIYDGRVTWGAHLVCCFDKQVFDPILENPISIEDYTEVIFGEKIKTETSIPTEEIEQFINR